MALESKKILITGYENPDLDNIASGYAYREFLGKNGIETEMGIFGKPHPEAQFLMDRLGVEFKKIEKLIKRTDKVILVDCSQHDWMYSGIDRGKVIEIYDHRVVNQAEDFTSAKCQIELVGACATLIAEKFYKSKIRPSKKSTIFLYAAIISNTINFQANVTTGRDKKMANWLQNQTEIPKNLIYEMFVHKSKIDRPIKQLFLEDFAINEFGGKKFTIFQLEIINVEKFVKNNLMEIKKVLKEIKKEDKFDIILLTCVDLEKGHNTFVIVDKESEEAIGKSLKIGFKNGVATKDHVIMRKEIMPLLKDHLEKKAS